MAWWSWIVFNDIVLIVSYRIVFLLTTLHTRTAQ